MQKNGNLALLKCRSKCWSNHHPGFLHRKVVPQTYRIQCQRRIQFLKNNKLTYDVKRDGYAGNARAMWNSQYSEASPTRNSPTSSIPGLPLVASMNVHEEMGLLIQALHNHDSSIKINRGE